MKSRILSKKFILYFLILVVIFSSSLSTYIPVYATQEELNDEAEERKTETVDTNNIPGWIIGPAIGAKGAILMDANSGAILYSKNIDEELFPASTTKIMTCLVAIENCSLDELITVNQSAIDANDPDGSNMGLKAGDKLTLEEMLYGILINSANEACNAVGEHIAGSQEAYVEMMNEKAKSLGCTHTHFVTTNGLQDPDHYVSAHDLALIAKEFFKYDILCKISSTGQYTIPANAYHKEFYLLSHNKLTAGREYAYDSLVGTKTGFTSASRQTLVSMAEKNGMRLICVILREESPYQFADTVSLFDYGFNNFSIYNVSDFENKYNIKQPEYFSVGSNIFGHNSELINIESGAKILIPNTATTSDLDSEIVYNISSNENAFSTIKYSYNGAFVGQADLLINTTSIVSNEEAANHSAINSDEQIIFNINKLMIFLFSLLGILVLVMMFGGIVKKFVHDQIRIYKIKKARKENEPKRRPTHRKIKKIDKEEKEKDTKGFSKKRKHTVYKKPNTSTLYDKDADKPGNKEITRRNNQSPLTKTFTPSDDYERIDIDIDEDE